MNLAGRLRSYRRADLRGDTLAALVTTTLAVPQGMAYAMLAGLPPQYGIYASIVPALAYAWIGSSSRLAVGPVALICLIVATGLEPLATPMTAPYIGLAVLMSLMVGVGLLVLGLLRAGFLVNFLGHPAIVGFTAAAAVLTAMSQVRGVTGIPPAALAGEPISAENPWPVLRHLNDLQPVALGIGASALVLLLVLRRIAPRVPGALVVCALGGLVAWVMKMPALQLPVVGEIPRALPVLAFPSIDLDVIDSLSGAAASVIVLGYGTSIAVAKSIASKHRERIDPNRELLALGASNLVGAFASCFPVSGSLGRSQVMARSGARTQMAGLLGGVFVLVAVLGAAPALGWLPIPVLAAIIIDAAMQLVDVKEAREVFRTRRSDGATLVLTFAATLGIGLVAGLAAGLVAALLLFAVRSASPHSAELGRIPGTMVYRNVLRHDVEVCPQAGILRVDAPLYYANARFLEDRIDKMFAERPDMQMLVLDCSGVGDLDATAVQSLRHIIEGLRSRGNDLHLVGAIGPVRDMLARSSVAALLGPGNIHRTILEAAPVLMQRISREHCRSRCRVSAFPDCTLIPRDRLTSKASEAARFSPQI